jgi:NhaA family Na+:H+ antiporter
MTVSRDEAEPIDRRRLSLERLARLWQKFLHVESASGLVLLGATCIALLASNSPVAAAYHDFWQTSLGLEIGQFQLRYSLEHWVNDGLMTIFFFVVGLEVKRELVEGELRDARRAMLPIVAAIGGMIVPAAIYAGIIHGQAGAAGWGIPMATDIAFVVGCMALLGRRVPHGLRVMLLTLAIVDDIGAIIVIAVGYSHGLRWEWLGYAAAALGLIALLRWIGLQRIAIYAIVGVFVWFAVHQSGVHATIAGVILGLMTPMREEQRGQSPFATSFATSPLEYLESMLHPWVAFGIMPVFALANAGVALHPGELKSPIAWAVIVGLVIGKPLGVMGTAWLAVRCGLVQLPDRVNWKMLLGGGALAGIGFTMALFIAGLALDSRLLDTGKIGVLCGSLLSAMIGMIWMMVVTSRMES